ncbi:MAG: hypothetical protein ACI4CS_04545 [Candidatus Weimeria sp.]
MMKEENEELHEYELMGKKFYVSRKTLDDLKMIMDIYTVDLFSEYGSTGVPEFLYGLIESSFEKELNGKKPAPSLWPKIINLMMSSCEMKAEKYIREDGKSDDSAVITDFLASSAEISADSIVN